MTGLVASGMLHEGEAGVVLIAHDLTSRPQGGHVVQPMPIVLRYPFSKSLLIYLLVSLLPPTAGPKMDIVQPLLTVSCGIPP